MSAGHEMVISCCCFRFGRVKKVDAVAEKAVVGGRGAFFMTDLDGDDEVDDGRFLRIAVLISGPLGGRRDDDARLAKTAARALCPDLVDSTVAFSSSSAGKI